MHLRNLSSQPQHFRERRDHRRHQLYSPKCGGSNNGTELRANKVAMLGIYPDSPKTQKRICFSRQIQLGEGLIATYVDHANDDRASRRETRGLRVDFELLLFGKETLMSS